ncbi:hypothetical protein BHM03_00013908 [Ensete ventricosum]|uniref:Uncharacterized protein n=1 Tax=Ensete ventricosum TaxID=4639 RepID=A0A426XWM1_ENSVE|nr:hypothetical protein B296_00034561 [Ensete ventricosum]RZR86663.1 hypothetical protein BHM03_00013908 [Ensete ventricosum]
MDGSMAANVVSWTRAARRVTSIVGGCDGRVWEGEEAEMDKGGDGEIFPVRGTWRHSQLIPPPNAESQAPPPPVAFSLSPSRSARSQTTPL